MLKTAVINTPLGVHTMASRQMSTITSAHVRHQRLILRRPIFAFDNIAAGTDYRAPRQNMPDYYYYYDDTTIHDMCFGKAWTCTSFTVMVVAAVVAWRVGLSWRIAYGAAFLASKELLQLVLLAHSGDCNNLANRIATVLSWVHVALQPMSVLLFVSAFSRRPKLYDLPIGLSVVFAIFMATRLKELRPGGIKHACAGARADPALSMCRTRSCSKMGRHHVAYGFQLESADLTSFIQVPTMFAYFLLSFWVPLLLGDWQLALVHGSAAVASSYAFRHDLGEAAAVWCLNSFWMGLLTLCVALVPIKHLPFAFMRRAAAHML